ncbi:cleft lip and palate transmembrane protein 1-like protein [Tetranychus urticae]|uniref:Lipid scramblase CLPTM1L n=1 Tax=Tetranychus urticae TaxID=32264 RepID=T1L468_TETUR|nr:cleft lip and palate transmembrane protein 1-like protein [Tetranychus urticae]
MRLPSVSMIITGLFTAWIFHSMYTLYKICVIQPCDPGSPSCLRPMWKEDDIFSLFLCTSISGHPLAFPLKTIYINDKFNTKSIPKLEFNITLEDKVLNNGTLFLHAFLTKSRSHREVNKELINSKLTSHTVGSLTHYIPKRAASYKLLGGQNQKRDEPKFSGLPVTHWKPKIVIDMVSSPQTLPISAITEEMAPLLKVNKNRQYLPVLHISSNRHRVRELIPVEHDKPVYHLEVNIDQASIGKLRFILLVESSFSTMPELGFSEYDTDDVKGILFDTSLFLLLVTVFVSCFHLLFDFLAFKNDVQFWRRRDSMAGLSFSSLLWRCVSQIIIALYLHDQQTSLIVVIPADIGALIELWKLKKALKIEFDGFRIKMNSRSKDEKTTDAYDTKAMKYLSIFVLYPLVTVGAIYSLLYTEHKSWYSWFIQSAANGVYVFGFLFMLPQLFINYKLKSVAHLPWKAFMYKAFNTFIDDLFAFILTSIPTAHRVAAFRDDIVFLIYLYQRWLYPVDKSRVSEDSAITDESKKED